MAVMEVCGFNDWLLKMLQDYRCERVILIQPEERQKQKTDRRDVSALSELLWMNRTRFLAGKPVWPQAGGVGEHIGSRKPKVHDTATRGESGSHSEYQYN